MAGRSTPRVMGLVSGLDHFGLGESGLNRDALAQLELRRFLLLEDIFSPLLKSFTHPTRMDAKDFTDVLKREKPVGVG